MLGFEVEKEGRESAAESLPRSHPESMRQSLSKKLLSPQSFGFRIPVLLI
jgi:hypothetical protein